MNLAMLMAMLSGEAMMIDPSAIADLTRALAAVAEKGTAAELGSVARSIRLGAPAALAEGKASASGAMLRVGSVGVVDVWGVLMKSPGDVRDAEGNRFGTSYAEIRQGVAEAAADKGVKTILLRMDTPGGAAIPAETAAAEILGVARADASAGGKPVVALADGMMASAGYYLGSQATALYSTPSAWIGSIGTRMDVWNFKGLLDRFGISVDTIKSTWAKDIGSPFKAMGEKERAVLQAEIDAFDRQFVAAVMRGRGVDAQTVGQWQGIRGKIGQGAVDAGMADAVVNSAEALVMMLNAAPERTVGAGASRRGAMARSGSGVVAGAVGAISGTGGSASVTDDQAPAIAAAATAGDPAEGHMGRLMLGVAGAAAGLACLAPEAGGGGGGGGAGVIAPTAGELDRVKAEATAAANQANLDRTNAIFAAAIPFAGNEAITKVRDEAVQKGWTVEQFNAAAMKNLAPKPLGGGPDAGTTPVGVAGGEAQGSKWIRGVEMGLVLRNCPDAVGVLRDAAEGGSAIAERRGQGAAIARHWGFESPAAALKAMDNARGDGLAGLRNQNIALRCVAAHQGLGLDAAMSKYSDPLALFHAALRTGAHAGPLAAAAGVGSSDFPNLFANVGNKAMMAAFAMKSVVWDRICARGVANDFKPASLVGISEIGKFRQLAEGEPMSETRPVERAETIAVKKFGNGFSLTFETMVNDDMGVFLQVPRMIGEMAKYIPDDLLFALLALNTYTGPTMATDSKVLYHADHGNIGTGAALSYDGIRADRKLGRKQVSRGPDAVELDIDLAVWLVCTNQSEDLIDIASQEYVPGTAGGQNQKNTLRGVITPVWTNKFGDITRRWGFTRPGPNSTFEVRFLFGQETPTIAINPLSDMTAQRYDAMVPGVGVAARNWEGTVTNAGQ